MFQKIVGLWFVVACVYAAPAPFDAPEESAQPPVIPIIAQSEELEPNGTYKFSYETGNGIKREEVSYDKIIPRTRSAGAEEGGEDYSEEIHVQQGSYSYTAPDGTLISLRYIADENGFQPVGDHIPRAPTFDSSSFRENSGRALKPVDSTGAGSAPASFARSSKPEKPEPAQENAISESSVPTAAQSQPVGEAPTVSSIEAKSAVSSIGGESALTLSANPTETAAIASTVFEEVATVAAAEGPSTVAAEEPSNVVTENASTLANEATEAASVPAAESASTVA